MRDRDAAAVVRLSRFKGLSAQQVGAGVLFERDWDAASLEPRVVANLERVGGGRPGDIADATLIARDRLQEARGVLRSAGAAVLNVVEGVCIFHRTASEVSSYASKPPAIAWTSANLSAGLSLLATHYSREGRL